MAGRSSSAASRRRRACTSSVYRSSTGSTRRSSTAHPATRAMSWIGSRSGSARPAAPEGSNERRPPRKLLHVDPCCTPELERSFDERIAARDLAAYRRDGLPADQRRLLAALVTNGLGDQTVLDIGGGIGAIHHDLLRAGARSVMDVDG